MCGEIWGHTPFFISLMGFDENGSRKRACRYVAQNHGKSGCVNPFSGFHNRSAHAFQRCEIFGTLVIDIHED